MFFDDQSKRIKLSIELRTTDHSLTNRRQRTCNDRNLIEGCTCLAEERLTTLDESVQALARPIEVSLLMLISLDEEKLAWTQATVSDPNQLLANPSINQYFNRLINNLDRSITDQDERLAYVKALSLVGKSSILSSLFLEIIQRRKNNISHVNDER